MRYTTEEAVAEILHRSDQIRQNRLRRQGWVLSGMTGLLAALLLLVICTVPTRSGTAYTGTVYGSFLLSPEAGGYVLAAVLAFALGVTLTLLCQRRKRRNANSAIPEKPCKEEPVS